MNFVILGGTGSLGKALAHRLLGRGFNVKVMSRCELKQKEMASEFSAYQRLKFVVGDIRDKEAVRRSLRGSDGAYLVAALKHVDTLELNPEESIKTNILGTMNVADAAVEERVPFVAFSSTDKAVSPVNVYGMSKAISERILLSRAKEQGKTEFNVFRWGNVVGSRGSVIPQFVKTLRTEGKAYITHPEMSRFWIRIEDAAEFMIKTTHAKDVVIPPMKAASVLRVVETIASILGVQGYQTIEIGLRPGEKIHEEIVAGVSSDKAEQYTDQELMDLLRPIVVGAK